MPYVDAGIFYALLAKRGIAWHAVRFDLGMPIPDLADFDALWVMGGIMNVWQEDRHPWLVEEKAAIREAVDREVPFLGMKLASGSSEKSDHMIRFFILK
ncbi:MAG: hypothetical protein AAF637_19980 [Pseudomonadota bacterium]